MSDFPQETIAAIATPAGKGGIGVIRVSGEKVTMIIQRVLGRLIDARKAYFLPFFEQDGSILDSGLALYFKAPKSFTGEDVLELHAHGSPVVLDLLMHRIISLGVRMARPGEFSERAFLNDKIDLAQAEAIADLIESSTIHAARSAQRSLQGEFSKLVNILVEEMICLRMYVEAAIDFVDEEIDFIGEGEVFEKLSKLLQRLEQIQRSAKQGCVLRDGLTVVIAGRPNVGKSSLLNLLAGRDAAIVTEIEGTTRDLLREYIQIDGMPLHVIDTAGLREGVDPVEKEGIRRALDAINHADLVLLMVDDRKNENDDNIISEWVQNIPVVLLRNKIDLTGNRPGVVEKGRTDEICLSVKTGAGVETLRQYLKQRAGYDGGAGDVFIARRRHLEALARSRDAVESGLRQLQNTCAAELLAEDLRQAQYALSEITGAFTNEDLLGRVFGSFCIGK
jgi:tRNA modification GTPase